jgi:hypothetical protein
MASFVRIAIYGVTTVALAIAVPHYTGLTTQDAIDMTHQVKSSVAAAQSAVHAISNDAPAAAPQRGAVPAKFQPAPKVHAPDPNADAHARASLAHLEKVTSASSARAKAPRAKPIERAAF